MCYRNTFGSSPFRYVSGICYPTFPPHTHTRTHCKKIETLRSMTESRNSACLLFQTTRETPNSDRFFRVFFRVWVDLVWFAVSLWWKQRETPANFRWRYDVKRSKSVFKLQRAVLVK